MENKRITKNYSHLGSSSKRGNSLLLYFFHFGSILEAEDRMRTEYMQTFANFQAHYYAALHLCAASLFCLFVLFVRNTNYLINPPASSEDMR